MASQDWEIVAEPPADAYDQVEVNELRPCRVGVAGGELLFCLEPKGGLDNEAASACAASMTGGCRTCMHRIPRFAKLIGSEGRHVAFYQDASDPPLERLRRMRERIPRSKEVSDYSMVVIDAEFMAKYPAEVGPFTHVHFTCEQLTPADLASKLSGLSAYLNGSFDNRFRRLVDDPSSLQVIQGEMPNLARPEHWRSVTDWAVRLAARAGGRCWDELRAHEKYEIMVFAMLTGRSQGSVHLDMQQASNLVDFMDEAHNAAALRAMMDDRSDPETYQVSRVAALLRDKCVTSLCTVTLMWGIDGQPHKSDLDLHTKVGSTELYYGNKRVGCCRLDFDANANTVERNPAENISLNQVGTYRFRVNNFCNRDKADVPFEVTVRKPGHTEVHAGVWPKDRKNGEFLAVCTVTVTDEDLRGEPVELSEAEQRKLAAKEAEWERLIGDPKSTLAVAEDLAVNVVKQGGLPLCGLADGGSAQEAFSQLLAKKPTPAKRPTLAERCRPPKTLLGLIEHATGTGCRLEVNPRNFAPAYITRLETKTDALASRFAVNAYHRKGEPPQPPRSDEPPAARFDEDWGLPARVPVHGFAKVGGSWFMVLAGGRLPRGSATWPLGGGMYPGSLKPEVHHHRSKWASFHCMVAPGAPAAGTPAVGSALVGLGSFQFIVDGREVTVRGE